MASAVIGRPYDRAERTKAMPKHSLFGAELQQFDDKEKVEISSIDLEKFTEEQNKVRAARQSRYKSTLPDYLQKKMDPSVLDETKKEVEKRIQQASKARELLDLMENKSRYFSLGLNQSQNNNVRTPPNLRAKPNSASGSRCCTPPPMRKPAEPSSSNQGAIAGKRYEHTPPQKKYPLAGIPVDFTGVDDIPQYERPKYERRRAPDWLPKEAFMKYGKTPGSENLAVEIPANIQHTFGTKVCQSVLTDKGKVEDSFKRQQPVSRRKAWCSAPKSTDVKFAEPADPVYEELSQAGRHNVFPGYTMNHQGSKYKTDFTWNTWDRRVPDPDQYRIRRDWLSTWAEHDVIRDRISKAYDQMLLDKTGKKNF